MALTLVEAAKKFTGDSVRSAIVELFAKSHPLLAVLPLENITGNARKYTREETLPGIAFRGVNEAYAESVGVLNPQVESLVIAGGDLDVDKFIVDTMGTDSRATHEAMKVKKLAHQIGHKFIKGDSETTAKEFDGLQKRLTGSQRVDAGSASGGDALSLAKLDELIDAVDDPTHLLLSKAMRRRLTQSSRNTSVGGFITFEQDAFGRRQEIYAGLPLIVMDGNKQDNTTLDFDEANPGGGSNVGTSIYCVALREGQMTGMQNGDMDVRDLGELDTKPVLRTRVEWYVGMVIYDPFAAARLRGIKDAAIVV